MRGMKRYNGFTLVEGLLIILILAVVSFGGWYVWDKQNSKDTETANSAESTNSTDDVSEKTDTEGSTPQEFEAISQNWEKYESGQGAYSIKLANGLDGMRDTTTDLMIFKTYDSDQGGVKLTDVDGYGSDGFTALTIYSDDTNNMWNPDQKLEGKTEKFTTYGGVTGTKVTFEDPYEPPCEGLGCNLGTKYVHYDFVNDKSGKTIRIAYARLVANEETKNVYGITKDSPDYTAHVEEMAKTLVIL